MVKKVSFYVVSTVVFGALMLNPLNFANAYSGQKYAKRANVTLARAKRIALNAVPGKITDEELEKESGGSDLRYSFDIRKGSTVHEVGVDAKSGKIVENAEEGPNSD